MHIEKNRREEFADLVTITDILHAHICTPSLSMFERKWTKVGERLQRDIDMLNSLPQTKSLSPVSPGQLLEKFENVACFACVACVAHLHSFHMLSHFSSAVEMK